MLSEEVVDRVVERLVKRIEAGNEYVLEKIGESIKKIGTLSPGSVHELNQMLEYGADYDKIVMELSRITEINVKEIEEIFEEVAKKDHEFAKQFYDYRGIKFVPYDENVVLQSLVDSVASTTAETYMNLSNTSLIGFNMLNNEGKLVFKDLKQAYNDIMDSAILNVSQGKESFDEAMYSTLKQLGESGLRTAQFESGRTMRMDSLVRMHLKGAIRNLHNEVQVQIGDKIGADGVEISVRENPAVDHSEVQGHQFSYEEFEKLQTEGHAKDYEGEEIDMRRYSKKGRMSFRPISEYNCHHYTYSVVLGVNDPQYSKEQLNEINRKNEEGFVYEDEHYTNYEGTQLQRKIELKVRELKDEQILAKASNKLEVVADSQEKITKLTKKYKELSEVSGLPTFMERMRVSGYRRTKVK